MMTHSAFSFEPMLAFSGGIFLLFAVVAGFVIVMGIMGHKRAAARREALAAWASAHGLIYSQGRRCVGEEEIFGCLRQGSNRYGENWITGNYHSWGMKAFDYHYETHSTDSKGRRQTHHHYFSAIIVQSKCPLGPLEIRPEGFFDKVGEFFGLDDIDFESAEFSRRFFVKSRDKRWAYDIIHQETMQFLLDHAANFRIALAGQCAIVWDGSLFTPEEYDQAAALLTGVLGRIPEHVIEQRIELSGMRAPRVPAVPPLSEPISREGPIRW